VDDVIVIAEGHLVAQAPLAQLLDGAARQQVRVRSPAPAALAATLRGPSVTITDDGLGTLIVTGLTPEAIGQAACDEAIVLHELTTTSSSLEETFFSLTTPGGPAS
jgi:ABC-2 type transport system ATP-binding protein